MEIVLFAEHQRRTFGEKGCGEASGQARREEGGSEDCAGLAAGPGPQHRVTCGPEDAPPPRPPDAAKALAPARASLPVALGFPDLRASTPCGRGDVRTGCHPQRVHSPGGPRGAGGKLPHLAQRKRAVSRTARCPPEGAVQGCVSCPRQEGAVQSILLGWGQDTWNPGSPREVEGLVRGLSALRQ